MSYGVYLESVQVNNNLFEIYVDLEKLLCGNCNCLGEAWDCVMNVWMVGCLDEVIMWR